MSLGLLPVEDIVRRFRELNPKLRLTNRAREAKFQRDYRQQIQHRLNNAVSSAVRISLHKNKGGNHWEVLVGYTILDLMRHIERQFKDGMSWENYGEWHIDHIIPKVAFYFNSFEDDDFKKCWALSNLQPLWASDNMRKYTTTTYCGRG